jgi:guanylate kinase
MSHEPLIVNFFNPQPLLIIVSGLSGVGKDTLVQALMDRRLPFYFVVTTTSRQPREGEIDGVDYFFVSQKEFQRLVDEGEMLEHAIVYGQFKGVRKTQIREALASGKDVVLRIDVQGVKRIRELCPDAVTIFLVPTDEQEWIERLLARKSETPESLQNRIDAAKDEMKQLDYFDYVVVNAKGNLDNAVDTVEAIISAEHHKVRPRQITL